MSSPRYDLNAGHAFEYEDTYSRVHLIVYEASRLNVFALIPVTAPILMLQSC